MFVKELKQNPMSENEVQRILLRALSDSTYHAEQRYAELPPILQKVVGNPDRMREYARMKESYVKAEIIPKIIQEYRRLPIEISPTSDIKFVCPSIARSI